MPEDRGGGKQVAFFSGLTRRLPAGGVRAFALRHFGEKRKKTFLERTVSEHDSHDMKELSNTGE